MTGFVAEHPGAEVHVSPNFGPRANGQAPDMILLHYTGMETGLGAEEWLCNPASEVSSHYLVHEDGRVIQMVREADRAWHAGKSFWRGVTDINSCSVGVEIVNPGHAFGYRDFPEAQMASVISLCCGIVARYAMRPERVLAHSDVAPGRKVDPGEKFDWRRLARHGLGHFVEPEPIRIGPVLKPGDRGIRVQTLQSMLGMYGYSVEISMEFDRQTQSVVTAFQRHFRPALIDGLVDRSTGATLLKLIRSLPNCMNWDVA
ncbi:MAG: N-acetylmuramoyl-L-alanine amidase [Rhizobiaceae bacterium]|nr:N-acetylmuramoyl-L-alanine amidase [Rhizobiaceae bacterium]